MVNHPNRNHQYRDRFVTEEMAALIKGMLARGDDQSDISACFLINAGRVSEVNTGKRYPHVRAAEPDDLPPVGPYLSPYEMHQLKGGLWAIRVLVDHIIEKCTTFRDALDRAEKK